MNSLTYLFVASIADTLADNLSMSIENIILFICACACLIIAAKSLRIAVAVATLVFVSLFIVYYELELNYTGAAMAFILTEVLLSISLLLSYKKVGGIQIV